MRHIKYLLYIIAIALSIPTFAQLTTDTITMPTSGVQNVSTCLGFLRDNGGNNGNYANNVNTVTVFTPTNPNTFVQLTFLQFKLENNADFLTIYNGNSTAAPVLGTFTGSALPPIITSTAANGTLTVQFTSNATVTDSGFKALVSCIVPCNVDTAKITAIPAIDTANIIRVCKGQSINFTGHAILKPGGTSNNLKYDWNFDDATTGIGANVNHAFANHGIYYVLLRITDTVQNCSRAKTVKVYVPNTPLFLGTHAKQDTICQFKPDTLWGVAAPKKVKKICAPPIADTTFLPDGTGVSYQTSIQVSCFDNAQVVTSPNDIASICINMEHSFLGDFEIKMICPNNQTVILKEFPGGGGTFLGGPVDQFPLTGPGVGLTYCFSNNATWGTLVSQAASPGFTVPSPGITPGQTMPAGTYTPFQTFNGFLGCPLNGNWTLVITDNWGQDDGYIFNWGLNFAPNLPIAVDSFTPTITGTTWLPDTTITYNSNNPTSASNFIVVSTNEVGTKCHTFRAFDNFGCSYDTTVCFYVKPAPVNVIYDSICPGQVYLGYSQTGTYVDTFSAKNGCDSLRILHLFVRPQPDLVDLGPDQVVCQYDTVRLEPNVLPYRPDYKYEWFNPNLTSDTTGNLYFQASQTITYILGVTPPKGCRRTDTVKIIVNPGDFLKMNLTDTAICPGNSVQLVAQGANEYKWSPSIYLNNPDINNPIAKPETSTQYTLIGTSLKGCTDTQKVNITVHPQAVLSLPDTINIYPGETYYMEPGGNCVYFQWFPNSGLSSNVISNPKVSPTVNTRYFVTAKTEHGCTISDSVDVLYNQTVIDMPNAYAPGNGTFKPSKRGIAKLNSFKVFNRWGQMIFETTDIEKGWDGSFNGQPQPTGTYIYVIDAVTVEGKPFNKKGSVTMVR